MAIIASDEMEDVEWLDESHVETIGVSLPPTTELFSGLPVITTRLYRRKSMGFRVKRLHFVSVLSVSKLITI